MRLALIIVSLGCGGAERVMATMANYWAQKKSWSITLITLGPVDQDFFTLDPGVRRRSLNVKSPSNSIFRSMWFSLIRIVKLREALRKSRSDAVISFMGNMNLLVLIATLGLGIKVIISQRNDLHARKLGLIRSGFQNKLYPLADIIVAQTEQMRTQLMTISGNPEKLKVIPNPVALEYWASKEHGMSIDEVVGGSRHKQTVVAMGSLTQQKGFNDLIAAFSKVKKQVDGWRLVILGEGVERGRLTSIIEKLGVTDAVFLPGKVEHPLSLLKQADLFVLSSRFEGFPNALLEAMACGLPVISTDCPSGPGEIISHDIDGVLVPVRDVNTLAAQMWRLMSSPKLREKYGTSAKATAGRFDVTWVMEKWEECVLAASSA